MQRCDDEDGARLNSCELRDEEMPLPQRYNGIAALKAHWQATAGQIAGPEVVIST